MTDLDEVQDEIPKKFHIELKDLVAVVALLLAIFNFANSIRYQQGPGEGIPIPPAEYLILRGVIPFPSDHLMLPMQWENSGGRHTIISHLTLTLQEVDTGDTYIFHLAGEYPEVSVEAIEDRYGSELIRSFVIDPHSVSQRALLFHIDEWWDPDSANYNFRFNGNQCFQVTVELLEDGEAMVYEELFDLTVFESVDDLVEDSSNWWDFWPLGGKSCNG